ncbi:MAG: hypothetical protein ISN29_01370 [Gammaproteobacteria bacterium AqS3]|nr:hypothetical protein [Gammaproteobacteria bacterium AqS3]
MRSALVALTLFANALIGAQSSPPPSPAASPISDADETDARSGAAGEQTEEFAPPYPPGEPDWDDLSGALPGMGGRNDGWYLGVGYSMFSGTGSFQSAARRRNEQDYLIDEDFEVAIENSYSLVFGYNFSDHFGLRGSLGGGAFDQSVSAQMAYPISDQFAVIFDAGLARYSQKEEGLALSGTIPLAGLALNRYFVRSTLQFGFYTYREDDVNAAGFSEFVDPALVNAPFNIKLGAFKVSYLHNFYRDY